MGQKSETLLERDLGEEEGEEREREKKMKDALTGRRINL